MDAAPMDKPSHRRRCFFLPYAAGQAWALGSYNVGISMPRLPEEPRRRFY